MPLLLAKVTSRRIGLRIPKSAENLTEVTVEIETAVPAEDATVAPTVDDVTAVKISQPPHAVMQVVTRVGAEAGVVMMSVDTHVVTEVVMAISIGVVVALGIALARDLLADIIDQETTIAIEIASVMTGVITEAAMMIGPVEGAPLSGILLPN